MKRPAISASRRAIIQGARAKWWIFGVGLPLLPVGARMSAAWLDGQGSLTLAELFGDGELLVLATVVAAAGIGDLTFNLRRDRRLFGPDGLRLAIVSASALVVVVASVLFFGLVTYAAQSRTDKERLARTEQFEQRERVAELTERAELASHEADHQRSVKSKMERRLAEELTGKGKTRIAGQGSVVHALRSNLHVAQRFVVRLEAQAAKLRTLAQKIGESATARLVTSESDVSSGRTQAALISVLMFVSSLVVTSQAVSIVAQEIADSEERGLAGHGE